MASERTWPAVLQAFTANGTSKGVVKVTSSEGYKVKARVLISSNALPVQKEAEVKAVNDETTIEVGPIGSDMTVRLDLSAYLVSDVAQVLQPRQKRPGISLADFTRAVYDEEPTVAIRTILVDEQGDYFRVDNPIPVVLTDGSFNIETVNQNISVQLTDRDNWPRTGDIHDSVRIGDGTEEALVTPHNSLYVTERNKLIDVEFDEIDMTYDPVTQDMTTAVYKLGGTTVSTVTLTYDVYSNLTKAVRS